MTLAEGQAAGLVGVARRGASPRVSCQGYCGSGGAGGSAQAPSFYERTIVNLSSPEYLEEYELVKGERSATAERLGT